MTGTEPLEDLDILTGFIHLTYTTLHLIVILFWLHTNNISNFNQLYLYTYCLRRMHIISKLWPKIIFNNFLSYQIIGVYYNLALNFITFLKRDH